MGNRFIDKLRRHADLSEAEIAALELATSHPTTHRAHKDIIREGDRPGPVLVVLEGWAFRYKVLPNGSRQIMAFLMPGDACDLHVGMLGQMDHGIGMLTLGEVATIPGSVMAALLNHTSIARAMYISQLVDESTLRAWIVSMGRRNSSERLSHLLLELYWRATNVGLAANAVMDLPFTQAVLADALGMTAVHINRTLQVLRRMGAVELRRGRLSILDPDLLSRVAGFDENYLHRRPRVATLRSA